MNNNIIPWLLIFFMSFSGPVSASSEAFGTSSGVNLKTFILDNTCSVDAGTASVNLGNYSVKDLSDTDSMTPAVRFNLVLKNCGVSAKEVNVFAEGEVEPLSKKGALATDKNVADAAKGVAIYIRDENNNILKVNDKDEIHAYQLKPGKDNNLLFMAQYTGTTGTPKAGRADSNVTLRFDYR